MRSLAFVWCLCGFLSGQEAAKKLGPFTIENQIPARPSQSQGRTGTCWSFSTVSFLESEVQRLHGTSIDLSEIWLARHAYAEKVRRFVSAQGGARLSEGGLSHDVIWIAKERGLVPADAFPGFPSGRSVHDHEELFRIVEVLAKEAVRKDARAVGPDFFRALEAILDTYLGPLPATVTSPAGALSPVDWTTSVLKLPLDSYVEVMSQGAPTSGATAKLDVPDNWLGYENYRNVELESLMSALEQSLRRGYSVVFDLDVSERGFRTKEGIAVLPDDLEVAGAITQAVRDAQFRGGQTTDDHLMHVVGLARHADGRRFFLTKDSGGPERGPYAGHVFISENYVRAKVLAFMVHGAALAAE